MLSTGSAEIEEELRTVRLELLRIFGVALLVTVLLSILSGGHDCAAHPPAGRGGGARTRPPGAGRDTRLHPPR